jgi:hypothetical protein
MHQDLLNQDRNHICKTLAETRGTLRLRQIPRPGPHDATAEHLAELGCILVAGLIRLKAPQSRSLSADRGESSADLLTPQSGDATRNLQGGKTR